MSAEEKPLVPKTAIDFQKMKLDKLMKNPEKPVIIPERPREKKGHSVPEFVRNVMGSSAGAGSGEFHVYRHLRRKEYARQKMIEESGIKEELNKSYAQKLEENKKKMEERTAKKRAKRLKRKERLKRAKQMATGKKQKKEEDKDMSDDTDSCNENSESDNETAQQDG